MSAVPNAPSITQTMLPEFDQEMALTRKVIERVPTSKGDWKPHPRSFSIGHLAQLLSWMPGWLTNILRETRLDMAGAKGYSLEETETLLADFDQNVREARAALVAATDQDLKVGWSLTRGDQVFMSLPRIVVVRQTINHLIHHRGQMTVYLRLIDVKVPSIYGPTADEPWAG